MLSKSKTQSLKIKKCGYLSLVAVPYSEKIEESIKVNSVMLLSSHNFYLISMMW